MVVGPVMLRRRTRVMAKDRLSWVLLGYANRSRNLPRNTFEMILF